MMGHCHYISPFCILMKCTPFEMACQKYGKEKVFEVIDNIISKDSEFERKTLEILVSLAVDEPTSCDAIYIVLRIDLSVLAGVSSRPVQNLNENRKKRKSCDEDSAGISRLSPCDFQLQNNRCISLLKIAVQSIRDLFSVIVFPSYFN